MPSSHLISIWYPSSLHLRPQHQGLPWSCGRVSAFIFCASQILRLSLLMGFVFGCLGCHESAISGNNKQKCCISQSGGRVWIKASAEWFYEGLAFWSKQSSSIFPGLLSPLTCLELLLICSVLSCLSLYISWTATRRGLLCFHGCRNLRQFTPLISNALYYLILYFVYACISSWHPGFFPSELTPLQSGGQNNVELHLQHRSVF